MIPDNENAALIFHAVNLSKPPMWEDLSRSGAAVTGYKILPVSRTQYF